MSVYEYVGNPHVHTPYSDGTLLHADVVDAAASAGLDFLIVTDHNVWVDGAEGYYDDVLLLVGEEIHDVRCRPQANHLLAYGAEAELAPLASDVQGLIHAVAEEEGFSYLAHPFERGSSVKAELDAIPWDAWDVEGYTGIELWNTMSEFKGLLRNKVWALFYAYFPEIGIRGPYRATLDKWDQLLSDGKRVSVIGGADAHGETYSLGALSRVILPYEYLFRCVNTHVLTDVPLNGELRHDKALIYDALRTGRTWVGYDRAGSTSGFRFVARSITREATMGEELTRTGATVFEVDTPKPAAIRLVRNGETLARSRGQHLKHTTASPGVYRVEAYRQHRLERRGWIFSSPIYVA
ncbi:MAG: CehA/McbA family metallohydrolase [Anaerolineae bacterium]|jgi:hypothetical protein